MSTARFEESLAFVLKWEGSKFTNDPDDHGGATRFGIIQREYDAYRRRNGRPARSVASISMDEVREIYRREYWDAVQGDRLPSPLDLVTFDTGVLMGVGRAIRFLQQSLNVRPNGIIGPETRAALTGADTSAVAEKFTALREARLRDIVNRDETQRKFLRGWLNRLNDLRRAISPPGQLNPASDSEALLPEEDIPAGRAATDLPADFTGQDEVGEEPPPKLSFTEPLAGGSFVEATAALRELARYPCYLLDARNTNREVLRVAANLSTPDWFEIPVAAVESVTPINLLHGDPTKVIVAVVFRPEFRSLAAAFGRLGHAGAPAGSFSHAYNLRSPEASGHDSLSAYYGTEADEDPASPSPEDLIGQSAFDIELARTLANYGEVEPGTSEPPALAPAEAEIVPSEAPGEFGAAAAAATMPIDIRAARAFLDACMNSSPRVRYGLVPLAKVPFHGAVPGRDFTRVDCSGFVREAIWRATTPHLNFIDGSVRQHDWIKARGFRRSTPDEAKLLDGVTRIAFLQPRDSPQRVGHVVLVHNARTLESHSGVGPNSRPWNKQGWQAKAFVYVLS